MVGLFNSETRSKPLRDYQATAIENLRQAMASGRRRPVLQAPTGAGKTRIAAEIISLARAKNKRVAFCVPALALIEQTIDAFSLEGIRDVGVMQADHEMTDAAAPVQVCSIQTIERRGWPDCDLAVIDEAHRMHKLIPKWIEAKPQLPMIGLSATPWARGMGRLYNDLIVVATTSELIAQGYLSPFRVFAPSHPDLSGVKIVAGDYHEGQLSAVMSTENLVGDVVQSWQKLAESRPTICFAVDCAHAQVLQDQFQNAGVPCGYQDANTSSAERAIIRDHFHAGRLKVVTNVGTLTTGVDWDVRCIVLARPTKSEMLFVQMIGRGLRTAEGKKDCLILDHSDTHSERGLGFVTDIHHDALDDGTPASAAKRQRESNRKVPSECAKCHALRPAGVHVCPECGFAPTRQSTTKHADGDLEELRPAVSGKRVSEKTISLRGKEFSLATFFAALRTYARNRGYNAGWPAARYRDATGTWPRAVAGTEPLGYVPPEIASWITAANIRWAKSRGNHA